MICPWLFPSPPSPTLSYSKPLPLHLTSLPLPLSPPAPPGVSLLLHSLHGLWINQITIFLSPPPLSSWLVNQPNHYLSLSSSTLFMACESNQDHYLSLSSSTLFMACESTKSLSFSLLLHSLHGLWINQITIFLSPPPALFMACESTKSLSFSLLLHSLHGLWINQITIFLSPPPLSSWLVNQPNHYLSLSSSTLFMACESTKSLSFSLSSTLFMACESTKSLSFSLHLHSLHGLYSTKSLSFPSLTLFMACESTKSLLSLSSSTLFMACESTKSLSFSLLLHSLHGLWINQITIFLSPPPLSSWLVNQPNHYLSLSSSTLFMACESTKSLSFSLLLHSLHGLWINQITIFLSPPPLSSWLVNQPNHYLSLSSSTLFMACESTKSLSFSLLLHSLHGLWINQITIFLSPPPLSSWLVNQPNHYLSLSSSTLFMACESTKSLSFSLLLHSLHGLWINQITIFLSPPPLSSWLVNQPNHYLSLSSSTLFMACESTKSLSSSLRLKFTFPSLILFQHLSTSSLMILL